MESKQYESDNESGILIDDALDTIRTKENIKKPKTKKRHKRKVKLGKDFKNDTETLYITQKQNIKKTKFHCVININNVSEMKSQSSIIKTDKNKCKREAYCDRIVPICTRNNCLADCVSAIKCCRTVSNRYFYPKESKHRFFESEHHASSKRRRRYKEQHRSKKAELRVPTKKKILSPISPITLSDSTISYEDISDASFTSEGELDTLIKRTKQRENQFTFPVKAYSAPLSSTPIPMSKDIASTSSGASHATSTPVIPPLQTEAYSPTTSPSYMCNVTAPHSPTMTSDYRHIDFIPTEWLYSPSDPTNTSMTNEDDRHEDCETENNVEGQYSLASPPHDKSEVDYDNNNHVRYIVDNKQNGRNATTEINEVNRVYKVEDIKTKAESEVYHNNGLIFETEIHTKTNRIIKIEDIKCEDESKWEVSFNNGQIFETGINENNNVIIKTEKELLTRH